MKLCFSIIIKLYNITNLFCFFYYWVILVLCMGITASAKAKVDRDAQSRYYLEQEKKMAGEVRRYLEEQGYRNSGVMITRTVRKDGHIVYKLTVHHRRISSLDETGKELLLAELERFAISDENCSCVQKIMQ